MTLCLAMLLMSSGISRGLAARTSVAAARTGQAMHTVRPKMWKYGSAASSTSLPTCTSRNQAWICCTLQLMLPVREHRPLTDSGGPAGVTEVTATSSSAGRCAGGAGSVFLIRSLKKTTLGPPFTLAISGGSAFFSLSGASRLSGNLR